MHSRKEVMKLMSHNLLIQYRILQGRNLNRHIRLGIFTALLVITGSLVCGQEPHHQNPVSGTTVFDQQTLPRTPARQERRESKTGIQYLVSEAAYAQ